MFLNPGKGIQHCRSVFDCRWDALQVIELPRLRYAKLCYNVLGTSMMWYNNLNNLELHVPRDLNKTFSGVSVLSTVYMYTETIFKIFTKINFSSRKWSLVTLFILLSFSLQFFYLCRPKIIFLYCRSQFWFHMHKFHAFLFTIILL